MARTVDRKALRAQLEAAERLEKEGKAPVKKKKEAAAKGEKKEKAPRAPTKRKAKKKVENPRLRMMWGVFDNGNSQVAVFPYTERAAADERCKELTERGRGAYFVQPVKQPIIEEVKEEV